MTATQRIRKPTRSHRRSITAPEVYVVLRCSPMWCPSCAKGMEALILEGQTSARLEIDLCPRCQAFWFDRHESLQLSATSILQLFSRVGAASADGKVRISSLLKCPRCQSHLHQTHDQQRNTP